MIQKQVPTPDSSPEPRLKLPEIKPPSPKNWREALFFLLESRSEIFQIEAQSLSEILLHRLIFAIAAIFAAFFSWCLLIVSSITILCSFTHWPTHWVVLACAALHILATIFLIRAAKAPTPPAFPVTRDEFKKDREWILKL